eukprot:m.599628 g.599628  ORF g.599628 m.599628 type:complete len:382 (-) comp22427_c0_seq3:1482-2627(-)
MGLTQHIPTLHGCLLTWQRCCTAWRTVRRCWMCVKVLQVLRCLTKQTIAVRLRRSTCMMQKVLSFCCGKASNAFAGIWHTESGHQSAVCCNSRCRFVAQRQYLFAYKPFGDETLRHERWYHVRTVTVFSRIPWRVELAHVPTLWYKIYIGYWDTCITCPHQRWSLCMSRERHRQYVERIRNRDRTFMDTISNIVMKRRDEQLYCERTIHQEYRFHYFTFTKSAVNVAQSILMLNLVHARVAVMPLNTTSPAGEPKSTSHSGYQMGCAPAIQLCPIHDCGPRARRNDARCSRKLATAVPCWHPVARTASRNGDVVLAALHFGGARNVSSLMLNLQLCVPSHFAFSAARTAGPVSQFGSTAKDAQFLCTPHENGSSDTERVER